MRVWTKLTKLTVSISVAVLAACGGDSNESVAPTDTDGTADSAGDATDQTDGTADSDGQDGSDVADASDGTEADSTDTTDGEPDGAAGTDVEPVGSDGSETDSTDSTDGTDGVDGVESDTGGLEGSDDTDGTADGTADCTDGTDCLDGSTDTDDAGTDTTDGEPPTPFEECAIAEKCADVALGQVCDTADPDRAVYPNDCYFFCQKKAVCLEAAEGGDTTACDKSYQGDPGTFLDDLAPSKSASCELPCPPENNCDIAQSEQQSVCLNNDVEYVNPYALCCATGLTFADPAVSPGKCAANVESCDAGIACPPDLDPICATYEGKSQQFTNSCWISKCAGSKIECVAPCKDTSSCPQCISQPTCAPVCGDDGNTYRNECYMNCLGQPGTDVAYLGKCCNCDPASADTLVCAKNGETYGNACIMTCQGQIPAYNGPCVPGCTVSPNDSPEGACGFYQGAFTKFPNLNCAQLANATCVYEGVCEFGKNECGKENQSFEPLCGTALGQAVPSTFGNACHAGCAGAENVTSGICTDCATLCPPGDLDDQVVCGPDCVLYPNSCYATKCAGFEQGELSKNACPASCNE